MYIAFEGHDGAGKTTTAEKFVERLQEQGKDVLFVRAPGYTNFGMYIRRTWHPNLRVRYLQFLTHHVELLDDVIKPHLAKGGLVVQDRTYISSVVYSAGIIPSPVLLAGYVDWITSPDRLFVLECPIDLALERIVAQPKDLPDPDKEELTNIQIRYKIECIARNGHLIDTTKPQEEVIDECLKLL